ncbi:LysR substrate-binding domain-containing protein [Ketogulonicigenium vulgare]|uniref:LysR substrate-binding domain-containing protein n=1 Tax=Ketogulonicigenium vulgare TaxID=92945 RepID=UPI0023582AC4|nr:LysR substrate-binding domain-containing protein [Ketogulonicigenium vulgare]
MRANKANLEINLLRTFVTGVQLGSFSQAAQQIGRTQSAISLQIKRLEQITGVRLLEKQGRGLILSPTGETLYRYALRILDMNDEVVATLRSQDVAGETRLGIPPDVAEICLPKVLMRLAHTHPEMLVEARVDRNRKLIEDLVAKALDIAVVWRNEQQVDNDDSALHYRDISAYTTDWIGARATRLVPGAPVPLVLMGAPCMFRDRAIAALDAAGIPWRLAFTSTSLTGIWAAVEAGIGITARTALGRPRGVHPVYNLPNGTPLPATLGTVRLRAIMRSDMPSATARFVIELLSVLDSQLTGPPDDEGSA